MVRKCFYCYFVETVDKFYHDSSTQNVTFSGAVYTSKDQIYEIAKDTGFLDGESF